METNRSQFEQHSFKSFLENYHVVIPMVQRDYAQGRKTDTVNRVRDRFLDSIKSYLIRKDRDKVMKMDFIYGEREYIWSTKVAKKVENIVVTPLDGQQRLTTLYLLHWYAAKKCAIDEEQYKFLYNFTYDIRPSSRDFCQHLMQYTPIWSLPLSEQLIDQHWFMGEWHNDPTIISMLVMLDSINMKFSDVLNLWEILASEQSRIIFYFLPLSENGLSDELYIKMNSRGKKLTDFEHFKAEYENLYESDSKEAKSINHKFDVEWADFFFPYRNQETDIVDDEFMRYFFYISHILCYEQNLKISDDEFELIKNVYKNSPNAENNRKYLEDAYDCWYNVFKDYGSNDESIDNFFKNYFSSSTYEQGKVTTFKKLDEYRNSQNFFHACLKLYRVNNNFSYSDFLFLYGIITYLINKAKIKENDFRIRLRTLRNLIWNSNSGEIRGDADYMKDLLDEVKELILTGNIKKLNHNFNGIQIDEEKEKSLKRNELNVDSLDNLYRFEDHPLVYGYVSGFKYENLYLVGEFLSLFNENPEYLKIHRAMLAIGDYRQCDSKRYYMGNHNRATWLRLFHKSSYRNNFEQTMSILCNLLKEIKNGKTLDGIIDDYLSKQEQEQEYDWRYYFVKYPDMLCGAEGELTWDNSNQYICTALNKHQFNGRYWNPFLNVIHKELSNDLLDTEGKKIVSLDNYGGNLNILKPISSLAVTEKGFIYYYQDTNEEWNVTHNDIDVKDRIEFAINKIKEKVKEAE